MRQDYLIGINYFNGWGREPDCNRWVINGKDWRINYPERIPVNGMYNDQETMDADILSASSNGVDFFQMLWYVQNPAREKGTHHLNDCFKHYKNSIYKDKISFVLEFCNHPPFQLETDKEWSDCVEEWVDILSWEGNVKIEGKTLFKIHGLNYFYGQCGKNIEVVKNRIEYLRNKAREKGVGELLIGAGVMADEVNEDEIMCSEFVDYCTTYADFPRVECKEKLYSFDTLSKQAIEGRKIITEKLKSNYVPFVMSGWYPRPWYETPCYTYPTKEQWVASLVEVKKQLDTNKKNQLLNKKVFTIYAWNEFGEGGIMAPTIGWGDMKLKALNEVFGKDE